MPGWSRQIELPEPADLLVAELIGNEPLEEEILETTLDARRRLLKPDARLVPHRLTLLARPLRLPDGEARQRAIGQAAVERWRGLYEMEFQPLLDAALPGPVNMPTEAEVVAAWPPVGPPAVLHEVDLATFSDASVRASADLAVDEPGTVNAVAVTFRAALHGRSSTRSIPGRGRPRAGPPPCGCSRSRSRLGEGSALRVRYTRRARDAPDGLTCEIIQMG